ncbi:phosphoribosyltransferase-like protein [Lipomyces doorenjongii]|uniref:phosphoribosyltransferase-like protein n=1 Tax=Lipomyces doorenjongii TaxID=383834 RepID=UPI0034CF4796
MCGICGILLADQKAMCASQLLESLHFLQHRGQDAAGIVTCGPRGRLYQCKGNGMIRDVFNEQRLLGLIGNMGVGHFYQLRSMTNILRVRYPTAGSSANSEAQPFYVNSPYGIILSHNGNLINAPALKRYLDQDAHRHINTDSDSELLLNVFASELEKTNKVRVNEEDIFTALAGVFRECRGAFACVGMLAGFGLIGFRDANGIRPLVVGERVNVDGSVDQLMASESVVLKALGCQKWTDLLPGQAVIIPKGTMKPIVRQVAPMLSYTPDIFEYVYFARPDTVIDGISVYRSRLAMGDKLAANIVKRFGGIENLKKEVDVVVPVPDTSRNAALQLSFTLGLIYREGFVKNRYVGRTFIMPDQQARRSSVRTKLNAMELEFRGRNVLIVDDSIVRGTTSKEIVQMAREAGAKNVYVASCAPPIRHNHIYGIDLADTKELVAYSRTEAEIAAAIGADDVIYQTLPDLIAACAEENHNIKEFEVGVFTGEYVTGVENGYLEHLEEIRFQNARLKKLEKRTNSIGFDVNGDGEGKAEVDIGLYNTGDYR